MFYVIYILSCMAMLVRVGKASWRKNALILVAHIKKVWFSFISQSNQDQWEVGGALFHGANQKPGPLPSGCIISFSDGCCYSVAQSCPTLCGHGLQHTSPSLSFPVLHYLLEFSQTHVCWINDAMVSNGLTGVQGGQGMERRRETPSF